MSRNDSTYSEIFAQCDLLIKSGRIDSVASLVEKLKLGNVPRPHRRTLAKICRRAGLVAQGLRLLHPIVRPVAPQIEPASLAEICEYAVLLSRIGSTGEAIELLGTVSPEKAPEVLLNRGLCHIYEGDYESSIESLEGYLKSSEDEYSKLVAKVNLSAAYLVSGDFSSAESKLSESLAQARASGATRLVSNCLELSSGLHFKRGDLEKTRACLDEAQAILPNADSYDAFLLEKWRAAIRATEMSSVEPLQIYQAEARQKGYSACVRDAELLILASKFDQKLYDHLIFGTPMPAFRERVQRQFGVEPSAVYELGTPGGRWLDLSTLRVSSGETLDGGKKIHRALTALCRDFYGIVSLGTLFAELYPGEYYDVDTSPNRIQQLLRRTRRLLEAGGIPIAIEPANGGYYLRMTAVFAIRIPLERPAAEAQTVAWEGVKSLFPAGTPFTAHEACEKSGMSRSSFHRLVRWAMSHGLIEKRGNSHHLVYEIKSAA